MNADEILEAGLRVVVRETSLRYLENSHARPRIQPNHVRATRRRNRKPSTATVCEFVCDGCGELCCRIRNGGPLPRFCSQLCNTRVWRAENHDRVKAQGRAYYHKAKTEVRA